MSELQHWVRRPELTVAGAEHLLALARAEARRQGLKVAVAVVDAAGVLLAFAREDGAMPASAEVAIGKASSAIHFARPSGALEDVVAKRPAFASIPDRILMRGGLPVMIDGRIAGAVGVSGAAPEQDEAVAAAAVASVAGGG
ncbi:MAG: heme-binding protein [Rhodocyclaceae bacterium]|nr:heme-binding protein [Rhodocyclaceae bacterium]